MILLFTFCFAVTSLFAVPPADATDLADLMGSKARVRTTAHFEVVHDVAEADLAPLVARLESTYNAIERFAKAAGFETASDRAQDKTTLDPPLARGEAKQDPRGLKPAARSDHAPRLKIILFDSQSDFERQLATMHLGGKSVAGFYDQATNLAVFGNARDHEDVRRLNEQIVSLQAKFRDAARAAGGDPGEAQTDAIENAINGLRQRREEVIENYNRFTIQHEAAHQVLFNLGVHAFGADNPPWLVEGLATQFEVPQTDRRGKLNGVNQFRLADFREALGAVAGKERIADGEMDALFREGRLAPIEALITDRHFNRNDGAVSVRYAEAWALVYFLHHERTEAFAAYLHKLLNIARHASGDSSPSAARDTETFLDAFGPMDDAFQRRFVRYILKLPIRN